MCPNPPVARNFQEFPKFAEISTISQIFLDNHIRNKIPNIFHIHYVPVYQLDHGQIYGGSPPLESNTSNNILSVLRDIYDADLKGRDALDTVGWGGALLCS